MGLHPMGPTISEATIHFMDPKERNLEQSMFLKHVLSESEQSMFLKHMLQKHALQQNTLLLRSAARSEGPWQMARA
jgi:hypothetical protein